MRLCLLLPLALLLVLSPGLALPIHAQQWTGALKMGGTVTRFSGETVSEDTNFEPRTGLAGGAAIGYDFGNGFAPQLEFLYVRKGAYFDADIQVGETLVPLRIRSDITYLEVPLLLLYRFETGGYVHPKLFAGPMIAFRLNARIQLRTRGSDITQAEDDNSLEDRDFGAVAGGGVEFDLSGQRLSVEARVALGMADITKPDPDFGDVKRHNQGIEILVGFVF